MGFDFAGVIARSELNMFKRIVRAIFPTHQEETAKLESQKLKQLVRGIATARPDEIGCGDCFEQLDCFVEMTLAGKNPTEAMPLVQDHLDRCGDCREEFEALLAALHLFS
jgi:hypothetical protein